MSSARRFALRLRLSSFVETSSMMDEDVLWIVVDVLICFLLFGNANQN